MKTKITLQGFNAADGEWFIHEVELVDATIDIVAEGRDRLSIQPEERGVNIQLQSLSRKVMVVRPVSTNSIDIVEILR